jgi:immune inhibitor A
VDARPAASYKPDGRSLWGGRWQTWDAAFGVDANSVTLHQVVGRGRTLTQTYNADPSLTFFDSSTTAYYDPRAPFNSVKTAGSGVKIDIIGVSADRGSYRVRVH